jgi:hypothetical protein
MYCYQTGEIKGSEEGIEKREPMQVNDCANICSEIRCSSFMQKVKMAQKPNVAIQAARTYSNEINLFSYFHSFRPPLWSSGQSSWLQIRRPGFDSRHYQKKGLWVWNGVHSAP